MEGVATPIFVDARIPTLPVDGFLAPLYAAITNIGNFIWSALAAAFAAIWAELGTRFPWFTAFWDNITANVVGFVNLFNVIIGYLAGFLSFLFRDANATDEQANDRVHSARQLPDNSLWTACSGQLL